MLSIPTPLGLHEFTSSAIARFAAPWPLGIVSKMFREKVIRSNHHVLVLEAAQ
jgi:hypothetical protein